MKTSNLYKFIVDELLQLSINNGDSVTDIARKTGYDRTHIYNIIGGRRLPSIDVLNAWAQIYGKKVIVVVKDDALGGGLITDDGNR